MRRIMVLLKDVVDLSELKVDPATRRPILEGAKRRIGELDKRALEEALRIREREGGEVCTLTVGDERSRAALLEALAMGADRAYLVSVEAPWIDALTTSVLLEAALRRLGLCDLILCGETSLDSLSSQMAPRLAELLDLPQATYVKHLAVEGGRVRAVRDLEDADEVVQLELPAVVSVSREINEPRIPSLMNIMRAKGKPIITLDAASLTPPDGISKAQGIEIIGVEAPRVERRRIIIQGETTDEAVERLVHRLVSEGVLEGL